jgi:hypothetical protein
MTVRMSMFVLVGAVTVVILMASTRSFAQTTPRVSVAVSGDADTGPETVSVVFQSGELSPSGDPRFLVLSFKITVKIGKQYTNGATAWFSTQYLVLHTPKGDAVATGTGNLYIESCSSSCTITYAIPSDSPGVYTITNDYVGCCGTKHGQVTFTVPSWRANSTAVGLAYPNPSSKLEPGTVQTPSPQTLQPAKDQTPQLQAPQQGGIPIPFPTGFGKRNPDDHDLDGFKTFDALTKAQQVKKLTKKGPRLPLEYDMSDLSFRAFVKGGWPIVLDYRLESGAFAELSISVNGVTPLITKIDPAKRAQLRITIPNDFGAKPQVAKLRITALTRNKEPAAFHLFGIAMGERGVLALWKVNARESYLQVAINSSNSTRTPDSEPFSLSTNAPQTSSSIQISVADPTTIRPRQRPPLSFSARCQSFFNSGRWELWHVESLRRAVEVWQESTGSILPNQTKSGKWNGMKSGKQVSFGNHFVQLTAWYGRPSDRDWVVASTDSNLIVIR